MWVGDGIQECWHGTVDMQRKVPLRPCFAHSCFHSSASTQISRFSDVTRKYMSPPLPHSTFGMWLAIVHTWVQAYSVLMANKPSVWPG